MKVSYYPGCSLEATARDYQESLAYVCRRLGIELTEIPDWSCCGATAAHSLDDFLSLALPSRNLALAERIGLDMVVPCPMCFNRLKTAVHEHQKGTTTPSPFPVNGKLKIWDLLDFLTQPRWLSAILTAMEQPLKDLTVVCYYGCMANRPPKITDAGQPENPQNMDRLLNALGARVSDWSYKTDCCGASHTVSRPDIIDTLVQRLYERALEAGAEAIVVSCQMCQANLDMPQKRISEKFQKNYELPVYYFTELIGLSWKAPETRSWLSRHLVDSESLLKRKGLL
ncbi:MAG TPA: CoB--CoM heterodisulfide reductase iron-sulfur subunit B family protein [Thermodesulfobacteriota bacterium]|nr:CoB--CoM heterodisulfide reductase iron-sulfur subunit B family protein [Thermodesulfobacteriota bacterium]